MTIFRTMTLAWQLMSRFPSLRPRTLLQAFHEADNLAARLTQQCDRSYSISRRVSRQANFTHDLRKIAISQGFRKAKLIKITRARTFSASRGQIITKLQDLPDDYDDEMGLSYRNTPITNSETVAIFGNIIDAKTADLLLRCMHGRRVAGTLDEPPVTNYYEKQVIERALAWLREHVPVDEVENAGLRAELELAEMELEIIADAERIGIYKPNAVEREDVYGEGIFDKIRKRNERKWEEQRASEERKIQADEIQQNTGTLQTFNAGSSRELQQTGEHPWLTKYKKRSEILPDSPPDMTAWQRLWPSGILVLSTVGTCIIFAQLYTPPKKSARLWPDMPPSAATVISIIIVNTAVFCLWRIPPAWRFLNRYFITYPGFPIPLSLLGNNWSHQFIGHFAMNMGLIYLVGTRLHEEIGRGNFLALYVASGVVASYCSMAWFVLRNVFVTSSMGASGNFAAILGAYLLISNTDGPKLLDILPENWPSISALTCFGCLILLEAYMLAKQRNTLRVDHVGHLTGYAAGAVGAYMLSPGVRAKKAAELEKKARERGLIGRVEEGSV